MQDDAAFFFQVAIHPDVVVAGEIVHLDAHIGQFGEFSQKACVTFGYGVFPLVPEVEHITEQIYGCCFVLDVVKKPHQPALLHSSVIDSPRS